MTTIKNVTEEKERKNKNLKSLIEFLSANKIDNHTRGVKKKKKRKKKIQKNLQNKSKNKNNKCFS